MECQAILVSHKNMTNKIKIILISVFTISLIIASFFFYSKNKYSDKESLVDLQSLRVNNAYIAAIGAEKRGDYTEAINNYDKIKEMETNMKIISYIKMKQAQTYIHSGNEEAGLYIFRELSSDESVNPKIRSMAVENIFKYYSSSNKSNLDSILFKDNLSSLKTGTKKENLLNIARYGNDIYPSTLFISNLCIDYLNKNKEEDKKILLKYVNKNCLMPIEEELSENKKDTSINQSHLPNRMTEKAILLNRVYNSQIMNDRKIVAEAYEEALNFGEKLNMEMDIFNTAYHYAYFLTSDKDELSKKKFDSLIETILSASISKDRENVISYIKSDSGSARQKTMSENSKKFKALLLTLK